MKSCCVTGHREIPPDKEAYVRQALRGEITRAVRDGYDNFLFGFAEGADQLFAEIVAELKKGGAPVRLEAAIPYRPRLVQLMKKERTRELLFACDWLTVHAEQYSPAVFKIRNQFLVDQSQRVIAVYDGRARGGTAQTLRMARDQQREVRIILI